MNKNTVINTYNESSLHNTLKKIYAIQNDGEMEIQKEGFIFDVFTKEGTVIEIQTRNLSKLLPKILTILEKNYKVKLVHPIIITKKIILSDENQNTIYKRKSPKKGNIYDIFNELTGIYPVLLHPQFTLELPLISISENRMRTKEPGQSPNNRRRFKKNWIKTNKALEEILEIKTFSSAKDFLSLLPETLPEEFCAKDLKNEFTKSKIYPDTAAKKANLILWVYSRMDLISFTEKKNRSRYYKINSKQS